MKHIKSAIYLALMLGYFTFVGVGNTMLAEVSQDFCHNTDVSHISTVSGDECQSETLLVAEPLTFDTKSSRYSNRIPAGTQATNLTNSH